MRTNRGLQKGTDCGVSPDELKNNLKRGLDNLKESLEILKNEPQGSFESKIVEGSKDSVTQLEQWVGTVCSSIWINCDLGNLICKYRNILESFIIKLDTHFFFIRS